MHKESTVHFCHHGRFIPLGCLILFLFALFIPALAQGKIYIDINAPSIRKFNIALPDFKNRSDRNQHPEFKSDLPYVLANDLDFSGFFSPMDKEAFLEDENAPVTADGIHFKDWSVIGAELLLKGSYSCIGSSLEVEVRLFDVFWGRQILGKRVLGEVKQYRDLMHRLGNEVIKKLTGHEGIFQTKLAFVSNATGHKEIYLCDYDGENIKQITSDRSIALSPRLSPDGKQLVYTSYKDGAPLLYLKNLATGAEKRISARSGLNVGASWAFDGSKLALTLSRGGDPDIYAIDLNGKMIKGLVRHWGIDTSPTFSPDGKKLAFVSDRSGSPQIYLMDLVSGRQERLTFEGRYNTDPCWSVMNRIVFSSMEGDHIDICSLDADGGQWRKLTGGQGKNEDPCWSPDGRYIVFSSRRGGERYQLYIMNANGQNQRKIELVAGDNTDPSWSP